MTDRANMIGKPRGWSDERWTAYLATLPTLAQAKALNRNPRFCNARTFGEDASVIAYHERRGRDMSGVPRVPPMTRSTAEAYGVTT